VGKHVKSDLLTYSEGGFPSLSVVAKQYQVSDGILCRVGTGLARQYNPFCEVELPTALARISSGEISPLEFAFQFGELGYSRLVRNSLVPAFPTNLPKTAEWKAAYDAYQNYRDTVFTAARDLPDGDPMDWLLAQSKTVALCLNFIGLLAEGKEQEIREALEGIPRGPYAWRERLRYLPLKEWRQELRGGAVSSTLIRRSVCDLITENIAGVKRWVLADPRGLRPESSFLCSATIEAVYWQLADRMEARMIRRCAECRRFFAARDKRQQYCPPLPGSTRSRCSSKLNVTNFRLRQLPT
jgi:hypothetical protein